MNLFEDIVVSSLIGPASAKLFVIDEIGVIGGWSPTFVETARELLASKTLLLTVVRQRSGALEDEVRQRTDF